MPTETLKVALAAGGTGGHIYPAVALAQVLLRRHPAARILFIGARRGREASIVPQMGYQLVQLAARPFPRFIVTPAGMLALVTMGMAGLQALRILKKFNPHVVITTGGYASACAAWAAYRLSIPLVLFEANAIPGRANRKAARWASAICVAFPEATSSFARVRARVVHTGMPVREEVRKLNRELARRKLGLTDDAFAMLVFGGSHGARSLNRALWQTLTKLLNDEPQLHIYHICGEHSWEEAQTVMDEVASALRDRYHVQPYAHDLPLRIHAVDLAISRAGSGSIAELLVAGVPSILVPYPYAIDDHQQHNAKAIAQAGAAIVVPDEHFNGDAIYSLTRELIHDAQRRMSMHNAALKCAIPDAAERLLDVALETARLI